MSNPRDRQDKAGRGSARSGADAIGLDRGSAASAEEQRELHELVALLRSLPDPEPPERLVGCVMARVAEIESRPWGGRWYSGAAPALGTLLAAGVAGLLIFSGLERLFPTVAALPGSRAAEMATGVAPTRIAAAAAPALRSLPSSLPSAPLAGMQVAFFGGQSAVVDLQEFEVVPPNAIEVGLDRQLNFMLLDPAAFFQRLERVRDRDRFIARLTARAAARGDATQLALRLRSIPHRDAVSMSDQLLKASLVEYASQR